LKIIKNKKSLDMVRVKRGNVARKKRKKILHYLKGFKNSHSTLIRVGYQQYIKSLRYSFIGRKQKKRNFRKAWIVNINSSVRQEKTTYSKFISNLKKIKIALNRKMLFELIFLNYKLFLTFL
jgi:large subunit ribosomal protein L20